MRTRACPRLVSYWLKEFGWHVTGETLPSTVSFHFVPHRDTVLFTQSTWLPPPTCLSNFLLQEGRVTRLMRGGFRLPLFRKGLGLRQSSVSTS